MVLQCKVCDSFSVIENNECYYCTVCSECFTIKNKKIHTKSRPYNNKKIHFSNVMKELIYNNDCDAKHERELKQIISNNNIDINTISSTFIAEYLKKKNIKNYKQTIFLMNACTNTLLNYKLVNISHISIIFDNFIRYLYSINYKKGISYGYILYKIFISLDITDNLKPNYTKTTKKDDKDDLWNNFILFICNNKRKKINYILQPPIFINNIYISNIPKLLTI